MQNKLELQRQIELTKANIEVFTAAMMAGDEVQDIHWQKWLKFEEEILVAQEAQLKEYL